MDERPHWAAEVVVGSKSAAHLETRLWSRVDFSAHSGDGGSHPRGLQGRMAGQKTKRARTAAMQWARSFVRRGWRDLAGNDRAVDLAPGAGDKARVYPRAGKVNGLADVCGFEVGAVGGAAFGGEEGHRLRSDGRGAADYF